MLAAFLLTFIVIIVATKLKCRVRASSSGGVIGGKIVEREIRKEWIGGYVRKSSTEQKLMTIRNIHCGKRDTASFPLQRQQVQQQMHHQPRQQIQQRQQQLTFAAHPLQEIGKQNGIERVQVKDFMYVCMYRQLIYRRRSKKSPKKGKTLYRKNYSSSVNFNACET